MAEIAYNEESLYIFNIITTATMKYNNESLY